MAKGTQSGLSKMMTSSEVAEQIAGGEYEEARPSRAVELSTKAEPSIGRMRPPFLSILQSNSEAVVKKQGGAGQLMIRNFPPIDEALLVPLGAGDFREYRPNRDAKNAQVQCFSPDGLHGEGDPGGVCAECPLSQWGAKNPATGTSTPPPCKEGVMVAFYCPDYKTPVLFPFRGRDIRTAEDIRMRAAFSGYGSFAVTLKPELVSNPRGQMWYAPRIEFLLDVPEAIREVVDRAMGAMAGPPAPPEREDHVEAEVVGA